MIMRAPPDPEIVGADRWRAMWQQRLEAAVALSILWNEHQTLDAKWKDGSIQEYGAIRCAVYNVGGMLDSYLPSVTRMMERAPQVPQKALDRSLGAQMARVSATCRPPRQAHARGERGSRSGGRLAADRGALVAPLAQRRGQRHHGRAAGLGVPRGSSRRPQLPARYPRHAGCRSGTGRARTSSRTSGISTPTASPSEQPRRPCSRTTRISRSDSRTVP